MNGSIRCQWHTNCHRSFMITCNLHGPRLLSLCLVKPWATAIVVRKTLQLRILCSSFPYLTEREKISAQAREIEGKWSEWIKKKKEASHCTRKDGFVRNHPSRPLICSILFMFMLDNIFCTHTWITTKEKVPYHAPPARISVREVLISVEAPKTEKSEIYCIEKGSLKSDKWTRKFTFIRSYVKIPMWVGVTLV